jgi:AcrR family transcriptional regulator
MESYCVVLFLLRLGRTLAQVCYVRRILLDIIHILDPSGLRLTGKDTCVAEKKTKTLKAAKRIHRGAGRPAAREVESRVEHLLDLATTVFLECGYEDTKIAEIAVRAGASKGTIYSRYPSKADLFAAVITRKSLQLQMSYAETLVAENSLKKVLESYGDRLVRGMFDPGVRSIYKVFIAASPRFPKLAKNFWNIGPHRSMEMLQEFFAKHSDFKGENPAYAAELFWSLCCGQFALRSLLLEEEDVSEKHLRFRVKEAVRVFMAAFA